MQHQEDGQSGRAAFCPHRDTPSNRHNQQDACCDEMYAEERNQTQGQRDKQKALQERKNEWHSYDSDVHGRHHIKPCAGPASNALLCGGGTGQVQGCVSGSTKSSPSMENASLTSSISSLKVPAIPSAKNQALLLLVGK